MSQSNPVVPLCGTIPVAAATAGTAADLGIPIPVDGKVQADSAYFTPAADVTADDTNYATLAVKVGSTTLGSITTQTSGSGGTDNLSQGTPVAISLSSAGSNLVAKGGHLTVSVTKAGTGVAISGDVTIGAKRVRAD